MYSAHDRYCTLIKKFNWHESACQSCTVHRVHNTIFKSIFRICARVSFCVRLLAHECYQFLTLWTGSKIGSPSSFCRPFSFSCLCIDPSCWELEFRTSHTASFSVIFVDFLTSNVREGDYVVFPRSAAPASVEVCGAVDTCDVGVWSDEKFYLATSHVGRACGVAANSMILTRGAGTGN